MTVISIILLILLSLICLLFLVLLPKLSVRIIYDTTLKIYAGYSFISIKLYPSKEKKKKQSKKQSLKKSNNKKTPTQSSGTPSTGKTKSSVSSLSQPGEKASVSETVSFIVDIIKKVGSLFGRHGEIHINKLHVTVSKEEACDTAVHFGLTCSAVSGLLALCSLFGKEKINHKEIQVVPDFITGKSNLSCDIKLYVRGIFVVTTALKILINKLTASEKNTKG